VECREGKLLIDGAPAKWLPLNPVKYPVSWKRTISSGNYFILPSDAGDVLDDLDSWQIAEVSADAIVGRVMVRTQPFNRFAIIR
jgi:hypothetical protein